MYRGWMRFVLVNAADPGMVGNATIGRRVVEPTGSASGGSDCAGGPWSADGKPKDNPDRGSGFADDRCGVRVCAEVGAAIGGVDAGTAGRGLGGGSVHGAELGVGASPGGGDADGRVPAV